MTSPVPTRPPGARCGMPGRGSSAFATNSKAAWPPAPAAVRNSSACSDSIWNWEVLSDEKEQGVTLGKLVILLSYILAGLFLAYAASWLVGSRLLHRLGWHRGKAAALKSILFYALCLFFGAVAFRVLRVPLGAFAFLGGAAAIAVGFGSQDILNNFMSGIILLTEQPIRVGDVIELGGEQGKVTYIGLRSTRLLTEANHELIVANKMLLDEQVKNLTLSDQFVQTTILIDVDRNLPVAETKRKMLELTFSHPMVIKTNRPVVLLKEVDGYCAALSDSFLDRISQLHEVGDRAKRSAGNDHGGVSFGRWLAASYPAGSGEQSRGRTRRGWCSRLQRPGRPRRARARSERPVGGGHRPSR